LFSLTAALAAYRTGAKWLDEILAYIKGNYGTLLEFLKANWPEAAVSPLEGTYLALVDVGKIIASRGFADDRALTLFLEEEGRVRFSQGSFFGPGGEGKLRVNLACPRSLLVEGLERAAAAIARRS
jgi:cysteine-S-conjugate beta-lyase